MINRKIYKKAFKKENIPEWKCPSCNAGILQVSKEDFLHDETADTKAIKNELWFDAEQMASLTYTTLLTCTNPK